MKLFHIAVSGTAFVWTLFLGYHTFQLYERVHALEAAQTTVVVETKECK